MSLNVYLQATEKCPHCGGPLGEDTVYSSNITHNLNKMAEAAGIYEALWRPYRKCKGFKEGGTYEKEYAFEKNQTIYAKSLIKDLEAGLKKLKEDPEKYKKYNSPNGWGLYENFVPFVESYLEACKKYPKAIVTTWR
jgi:hypothetical protein